MRKGLLLFAVVALAQWAVPAWMVRSKERVRAEGTTYKFKLQPIDPYDPFRGEYVILRYEAFNAPMTLPDTVPEGTAQVYALLGAGPDGFARVEGLTADPPAQGDGLRVTVHSYWSVDTAGHREERIVRIEDSPIDRYYLQEGGGHIAEGLVRWRQDTSAMRMAYALVRVSDGDAVVEDLIIDGRPVNEWIDQAHAAADTALAVP